MTPAEKLRNFPSRAQIKFSTGGMKHKYENCKIFFRAFHSVFIHSLPQPVVPEQSITIVSDEAVRWAYCLAAAGHNLTEGAQ